MQIYKPYFSKKESMRNFCQGIRRDGEYASFRTIRVTSDCLGLPILVHKGAVNADRFATNGFAFLIKGKAHGALHVLHTGPDENGHFRPIIFGKRLPPRKCPGSLPSHGSSLGDSPGRVPERSDDYERPVPVRPSGRSTAAAAAGPVA